MGSTVRKTEELVARETLSHGPFITDPPTATRDNMNVKMVCGVSIRYVPEVLPSPPLHQGVQFVRHGETEPGE